MKDLRKNPDSEMEESPFLEKNFIKLEKTEKEALKRGREAN
jgi:hypothetical protein